MGITLEQAREGIGRKVIYRSEAQRRGRDTRPADEGVITSVGLEHVMVRYPYSETSAATRPEDLEFSLEQIDPDEQQDRMIDAREAMRTMGGWR